jgi:predicted transcriptional regulator
VPHYDEPSPQELHALAILWNEGPSTVGSVHKVMNSDGANRTYTTTLAVMRNLEKKSLVTRDTQGRAHVYDAKVDREIILKPRLRKLVQHTFGGSLGQAILALISVGVMTPEEKTAVAREIKQHKAMAAKKKTTKKKAAKKVAKKTVKPAAKKAAKKAAPKPAKKAAKKKVAKKAAKKVATKKFAQKKVVKKAAKKKVAKKATKKTVAKKAARKRK